MDHLQISTLSIILRTYVFPFIINGFISFEHGRTTRFSRQIAMQSLHLSLRSGTEILGTSGLRPRLMAQLYQTCITKSYLQNRRSLLLERRGKVRNTETYHHIIWSISYKRHMLHISSCYILRRKNLTRIEMNYVQIFEFLDSHCDNCNIQEQLRQCST